MTNKKQGISLDEFKLKMELEKIWCKKHWFQSFFIDIWDFFRYVLPGVCYGWKYEIKFAWQRVFRGYDNSAIWSHHSYHSKQTAEILRNLAENKVGCPANLFDAKNKKDACHKWKALLVQMAEGFEAATAIDNMDYMDMKDTRKQYMKKHDALMKKFDKGMKLYCENYMSLWD